MTDQGTSTVGLAVPLDETLVPVTHWVPSIHAVDFQNQASYLVKSLAELLDANGNYVPPFSSSDGPQDPWQLPKLSGDAERPAVDWLLRDLRGYQREILAYLVNVGPDGVWTTQLRDHFGYEGTQSMSGVFKAIAGRFRKIGRRPIWNGGDKGVLGQRLSVPDGEIRAMFTQALLEDYPDIAAKFDNIA